MFTLARLLRDAHGPLPVLLLTARDGAEDRIWIRRRWGRLADQALQSAGAGVAAAGGPAPHPTEPPLAPSPMPTTADTLCRGVRRRPYIVPSAYLLVGLVLAVGMVLMYHCGK
jgi:hypothetical protein